MKINRKQIINLLVLLLLILLALFFVLYWSKLFSIIRVIILGVIFAYILTPLSEGLERHIPRIWAILFLVLVCISALSLFFVFFLPSFMKEMMVIVDRIPLFLTAVREYSDKTQHQLRGMGLPEGIRSLMTDYMDTVEERAGVMMKGLLDGLVSRLGNIPDLFLVPVIGFYFLKDREYFSKAMLNVIPHAHRKTILQVTSEIHRILHQFIRGQVLISIIVAVLSSTGYLLVGLPYALILGLIAGILEIIPYFGPWLGAVPAVLIALISGPVKTVWTIVVILIIQQLESGIITPKVLGNEVELHPVYVILALLTGGVFFGIIGMLFAVPVLLIARIVIKHIYLNLVTTK